VKSDGQIGGYAYGNQVKSKMLSLEGIQIHDGKIQDFKKKLYRF